MSDIQAQFSVLKQTADPGGRRCHRAADRERRGPRAQPHQRAGFCEADRARRRAGDFGLPACLAARAVRPHLERAVPRLRRRARCPPHAEIAASATIIIAACAPAATRPRSTSRSRSPSPSVRGSGASRRTIPIRCRSGNISSRCSGVRASISTRNRSQSLTDEVTLDALELPAGREGAAVAAIADRNSSSCSSR